MSDVFFLFIIHQLINIIPDQTIFIIYILIIGIFEFNNANYSVYETSTHVEVAVIRRSGTSGDVEVPWSTRADSAIDGVDYDGESNRLSFGAAEVGAYHCIIFDIFIHDQAIMKETILR